ncbi:hypothetical protein HKK74_11290, partial [Actinomadura alba]|nr:hypothetical protein [Actinomadura alba]
MSDRPSVRDRALYEPGADRRAAGRRRRLGAAVRAGALRLRPRSIRGRMALLVTFIAVLLLAPAGVIGAMLARQAMTRAIWLEARQQAMLTAVRVRDGGT